MEEEEQAGREATGWFREEEAVIFGSFSRTEIDSHDISFFSVSRVFHKTFPNQVKEIEKPSTKSAGPYIFVEGRREGKTEREEKG